MKNYKDQIFNFLSGTLPKEKYCEFIKEINRSSQLRETFEKEANLEVLFYSQKWNSEDLLKQGIFSDDSNNFSNNEIKDLLPKENHLTFYRKALYYVAALFIISITLLITYFSNVNNNLNTTIAKTQIYDTTQNITSKEMFVKSNAPQINEASKKEAIQVVKKGLYQPVKLSAKASYIDKNKSLFKILKNNDSTVIINLIKGELQFSVETGSYKKFAVITMHAEVRVTGTIFSVYTDSVNTNTTVYRGSVLITDKSGSQTILEADKSNTLNINFKTAENEFFKEQMIIDTGKSFLNDFLNQYNKNSQSEFPKDSIISYLNDISYRIMNSIEKNLTPETDAQMMHFNAGKKSVSNNKNREAIRIFEQLLKENPYKEIKEITLIQLGQLYIKNNIKYFKSDFKNHIKSILSNNAYKNFLLLEIYSDKKRRSFNSFYKNSEDYLNQFPNDRLNDYLYWHLAQYDINKSDFDKAISRYENIIDKYPDSQFAQDAKYRLGWCLINRPREFSGLK